MTQIHPNPKVHISPAPLRQPKIPTRARRRAMLLAGVSLNAIAHTAMSCPITTEERKEDD